MGIKNRQRDDLRNRARTAEITNRTLRFAVKKKVHCSQRANAACRFYHAVGQRALPDTASAEMSFFVFPRRARTHGVIQIGDHTIRRPSSSTTGAK